MLLYGNFPTSDGITPYMRTILIQQQKGKLFHFCSLVP